MLSRVQLFVLLISAILAPGRAPCDEPFVAETFSKAAIYILNTDFLFTPVTETFTAAELAVLKAHQRALSSMIQGAFRGSHSVGASLLTAHFKLQENIPVLREQLFRPGTVYGWEGPAYDNEEDFLTDNQFVYHSVYLQAIEETAGRPIFEIIQPTRQETGELLLYLGDPAYPNYHWAKWLARRLRISEAPR